MQSFPIQQYISLPSEEELKQDIEQAKTYAKEHPEEATYFQTKEEIFQKELEVLRDPKNASINPSTADGAKALFNKMNKATKGLSQKADQLLANNPDLMNYGFKMGKRSWIKI